MGLETSFNYISDFNISWPDGASDTLKQADDHLRGIKKGTKQSFPNISGAVSATHTELSLAGGAYVGGTGDFHMKWGKKMRFETASGSNSYIDGLWFNTGYNFLGINFTVMETDEMLVIKPTAGTDTPVLVLDSTNTGSNFGGVIFYDNGVKRASIEVDVLGRLVFTQNGVTKYFNNMS